MFRLNTEWYASKLFKKDFTAEYCKAYRLKHAHPIINELGKHISEENKKVLPKSLIGKAFMYAINRWDNLQHYLYNGDLHIDNNLIENSIRPNALDPKKRSLCRIRQWRKTVGNVLQLFWHLQNEWRKA